MGSGKTVLGELVERFTGPPRNQSGNVGRAIAQARLATSIQQDFREDERRAAEFSSGRFSKRHTTANIQELLFLRAFIDADTAFMNAMGRGVASKEDDIIELILEEKHDADRPREMLVCRDALFEVLVAAERRGNIVYLPVEEGSQLANMMTELIRRGQEVQPKSMKDVALPKFEVRCIGLPDEA